jgi:hypothetical protein
MSHENLKGQGIEVPTGGEGLSDTAHAPGAGPEQRPLDEARAGKPETAPAPKQTPAAGPAAGAGAAGRGQKAAPRGKRVDTGIRAIPIDSEFGTTWGTTARCLERRNPELLRKVIRGEMSLREAVRAPADRPDGAPAGDPERVTPNFAKALYLADRLEEAFGLADGKTICFAAYLLLRRGLHAQLDKLTNANALYLADQLKEVFGLKDGKVICDVAHTLLRQRLAYRSGTTAAVAAPGQADTA